MSAESYCWFDWNYDLIRGLGFIKAVNCVHYNRKDEVTKKKFYDVIQNKNMIGLALDDCVALEVIDNKIKIIKNNENAKAYKIYFDGEKFIEEELKERKDDAIKWERSIQVKHIYVEFLIGI